jgi:hypothetical protein
MLKLSVLLSTKGASSKENENESKDKEQNSNEQKFTVDDLLKKVVLVRYIELLRQRFVLSAEAPQPCSSTMLLTHAAHPCCSPMLQIAP